MNKFLILVIGLTFLLFSCKQEPKELMSKNGYKYELFKTGNGEIIGPDDYVYFNMIVRANDSTILQNSYENNYTPQMNVPPDSLVKMASPIYDAITMMRLGDSIQIFQPIDSVNAGGNVKKGDILRFDIKVIEIISKNDKKLMAEKEPAILKQALEYKKMFEDKSNATIQSTESGIQYIIHENGKGKIAMNEESVRFYHLDMLPNASTMLLSNFSSGVPYNVVINKSNDILGWHEILQKIPRGSKVSVMIPSSLAYGDKGIQDMVPPKSSIYFYMELFEN